MTPEELLKPRYKVIADYPENPYKVGDILPYHKDTLWKNEEEYFMKFPHIFQKLNWWDFRERKEMPRYIKSYKLDVHVVFEVAEWIPGLGKWVPSEMNAKIDWHYGYCIPSTEEEYNEYIKSRL